MTEWLSIALLFIGAAAQYALATLLTKFIVQSSPYGVWLAIFLGQSIWWVNIQQTTRTNSVSHWLAWACGAATGGAVALYWKTALYWKERTTQ